MKVSIQKTKLQGLFRTVMMAAVMGVSGAAQAATSGTITISGVVPAATAIVVTGLSGYSSLDLSTSTTDLAVASIREINNTANGYTVTLASTNAGQLKNGTAGSLAYTAKYGGSAVTLSGTPATVTTAGAATSVVNVLKQLQISYAGSDPATMMQGSYTDTLTFAISAN